MPERESHREQVRKLLAQDQEINDIHLKEFRMQLEQSLESWEVNAKKVRRGILIAGAAFAALYVFWILMAIISKSHTDNHGPMTSVYGVPAIVMAVWASLLGSFFICVYLVGLYFFKYAPGLKRVRFDVQTTMMLELTQQVEQLRQDIERRRNS